jgi:AcrR family transcriptional regulator
MALVEDPDDTVLRPERFSPTQRRTIDAALDLFADHGVAGTSYQMIANAVGVSKAAIYHQFKTKDALVKAVVEVGMAPLEAGLKAAEAASTPERGREILLAHVIDLAVERRRWASSIQGDPAMERLLVEYEPIADLMLRVYAMLLGLEPSPSTRIRTAIVSAAIAGAISHPVVVELDDATVRVELMAVCRKLFDVSD